MKEEDIEKVAEFIDVALKLGKAISEISGPKLVDFKKAINDGECAESVAELKKEVENFSEKFPMPGFDCY